MTFLENPLLLGSSCLALGVAAGYFLWSWKERTRRSELTLKEQSLLDGARREAEAITREARLRGNEEALKIREGTESSFCQRQHELTEAEKRLNEREGLINRQLQNMVADENACRQQREELQRKAEAIENERKSINELTARRREELQALGKLTEAEARQQLLKEVEMEALQDASAVTRRIMEEARGRAEEKARRLIGLAIQRYAGEHTYEISSATVALPSEELKGRIIGREGRNIRAFESATGVTVLIDDTPNAVVLSGFDPVRREIARESMHRLILDGRIHPTRIEEVVAKVTQEMDETIVRMGEEAVQKVGLAPAHPEVIRLLGRLRFRNSFSQNVLDHSIEVAQIAGLLAAELGLEPSAAKRAGLFHDIGKAVSHEVEGAHALVGADVLRRCGESEDVVNSVAAHHDEVPHHGVLGILVSAADAISASRPGARSETMTTYIRRVEDLERIGMSFSGVEKCYAVQAGRELRILVKPDLITDDEAFALAKSVSRKIEAELQYPGQIRVTVLRETRCIEFAK